ncbi:hypothetical protein D3C71_1932360 [compost metagenome]
MRYMFIKCFSDSKFELKISTNYCGEKLRKKIKSLDEENNGFKFNNEQEIIDFIKNIIIPNERED